MAERHFRIRWLIALAFMPAALALSRTEPDKSEQLSIKPGFGNQSFFGNSGCAASGCHNANGLRGTPGSEYSTWANEDPHSRSFSVLNSEASQSMVRLYRPEDKSIDATKFDLCLKCHAPMGVNQAHLKSDAVGCESCHGSAERWRTTHYLNEWKSLDVHEKARHGMKPTKELTSRVELCADCHVGKKGMEVDHDLIAAGHPRLFFEYTAYHDLMPRHWNEKSGPAFYARAWAIGRVTAAKAAVELLHDRAADPKRWPELAEFNCYSCHRPIGEKVTPPVERAVGSLAAGSWHFSQLDAVAALGADFAPPQLLDVKPLLAKLHDMSTRPEEIAAAAKPLVATLAAWQSTLQKAGDVDLSVMKSQLANQQPADWEQATQHYLAVAALHRSQKSSEQRRDGVMALRDLLKFPPAKEGKRSNSPREFDRDEYWKSANKLLSQWSVAAASDEPMSATWTNEATSSLRFDVRRGVSHRVFANGPDGTTASTNSQRKIPGAALVEKQGRNENNAGDCKNCHELEKPDYRQQGVYDLITSNASTIWEHSDPHRKAWDNIDPTTSQLAGRMSDALGYDVSKKPDCLVCHAVDGAPAMPLENKKDFAWRFGVGCEACHGDAEKWFEPHRRTESWRKKLPEEKEKVFGLIDLRDPGKRAAKCASCHVGNVAEGKFVTHQMYAAGHPPLLPYEPVTYDRDQPRHWQLPKDVKYLNDLEPEKAKAFYHYDKSEDYVARSLAVGAVVNLRETANTLAQAASELPAGRMLDFAHFDCFACHHELVTPSQRQQRGYSGVPGRPTVRPLPTDLVQIVLGETGNEVADTVSLLHRAYDNRPFGDSVQIAIEAKKISAKCDEWLKRLNEVKYDEAGRAKLLSAIRDAGPKEKWDYDTAQQFTWAYRALTKYDDAAANRDWPELSKRLLLGAGLGPNRTVQSSYSLRLQMRYEFDAAAFSQAWKTVR